MTFSAAGDENIIGVVKEVRFDGGGKFKGRDDGNVEFVNSTNGAFDRGLITQHITSSGNISASSNIFANAYHLTSNAEVLSFSGTQLNLNNWGQFATIGIGRGNQGIPIYAYGHLHVTDPTNAAGGHITASGNISASGNIMGDHFIGLDDIRLIENNGGTVTVGFQNDTPISIGKNANPTQIIGHITASGNISSSGTIIASAFSGGTTGDQSGSLYLSGSLTLRPNAALPAVSESALYATGSSGQGTNTADLHFAGMPIGPYTTQMFNCGFQGATTSKVWLPFAEGGLTDLTATTTTSEYASVIMPFDGYVD